MSHRHHDDCCCLLLLLLLPFSIYHQSYTGSRERLMICLSNICPPLLDCQTHHSLRAGGINERHDDGQIEGEISAINRETTAESPLKMAVYNVRPSFWAGEIEVYVARRPTMPCPINDSSRPIDKTSLNDNFIKKKALDIGREKKERIKVPAERLR